MRRLAALGVVAVAVGLVAVFRPQLVAGWSMPSVFLAVIGGFAVFEALRVAVVRVRGTHGNLPPLPEPELRELSSVPGTEIDAELATASRSRRSPSLQRNFRDRLRGTALEVLTRYEGLPDEEAGRRLDEGTWTDDPQAAAFFATDDVADVSLRRRLELRTAGETVFGMRAKRAVAALADRARRRQHT